MFTFTARLLGSLFLATCLGFVSTATATVLYKQDFNSNPGFSTTHPTQEYWNAAGNDYVATVHDVATGSGNYVGYSRPFATVPSNASFALSFDFNPVNPNWGNYPGVRLYSTKYKNPILKRHHASLGFCVCWTDRIYKKFQVNSNGSFGRTGTIPAANSWYHITITRDAPLHIVTLRAHNDALNTTLSTSYTYNTIPNPFNQIGIGEITIPPKYGTQSTVKVKNILLSTSSLPVLKTFNPNYDTGFYTTIDKHNMYLLQGGVPAYSDVSSAKRFVNSSGKPITLSFNDVGKAVLASKDMLVINSTNFKPTEQTIKADEQTVSIAYQAFSALKTIEGYAIGSLTTAGAGEEEAIDKAFETAGKEAFYAAVAHKEITAAQNDIASFKSIRRNIKTKQKYGANIPYTDILEAAKYRREFYAHIHTAITVYQQGIGGSKSLLLNFLSAIKDAVNTAFEDKIITTPLAKAYLTEFSTASDGVDAYRAADEAYKYWLSVDGTTPIPSQKIINADAESGINAGLNGTSSSNYADSSTYFTQLPNSTSGIPENIKKTFVYTVFKGQPVIQDPTIAPGYTYKIGFGNPNFAGVMFPQMTKQSYLLWLIDGFGGWFYTGINIKPGQWFNFTDSLSRFGIAASGLSEFRITGINKKYFSDGDRFNTELKFVGNGLYTGTQTVYNPVPEPSLLGLMLVGLMLIVVVHGRKRYG